MEKPGVDAVICTNTKAARQPCLMLPEPPGDTKEAQAQFLRHQPDGRVRRGDAPGARDAVASGQVDRRVGAFDQILAGAREQGRGYGRDEPQRHPCGPRHALNGPGTADVAPGGGQREGTEHSTGHSESPACEGAESRKQDADPRKYRQWNERREEEDFRPFKRPFGTPVCVNDRLDARHINVPSCQGLTRT